MVARSALLRCGLKEFHLSRSMEALFPSASPYRVTLQGTLSIGSLMDAPITVTKAHG
ncbi:hypothetical protein KCP69_19655 [Salmonella enterica subsp. enterica]|nr:hypothetical protein KCP69_19655 [Salmonella enterica subsp. enterica]